MSNTNSVEYRIESRWPRHADWKTLTARPHGEIYPFDNSGLKFDNYTEAKAAMVSFLRSNEGEFRIVTNNMILYPVGLSIKL